MTGKDQIRAADNDRERAATRLRDALEEGRLTLGELDHRLQQVYAARTYGELDRVLSDLPATPPADRTPVPSTDQPAVPPSRYEANPKLPGWLSWLWRLWFVAVMINVVIWFVVSLAGGLVYFWPVWVAGPWAAVNVGLMIIFPPSRNRPGS